MSEEYSYTELIERVCEDERLQHIPYRERRLAVVYLLAGRVIDEVADLEDLLDED